MRGHSVTKRRVVVTGLGTLSPLGLSTDKTWRRILAGESGIGDITHFDCSNYSTRFAGQINDFDPQDYIDKKETKKIAACVFENIYFARPDSILNDQLVYLTRKKMGAQLAIEHPVDADLVIGVPDSATAAAVGYSEESGITFTEGLMKNRYVGRTFILPDQRMRDIGVRIKLNPLKEIIYGKSIIVVDDSIVRGTTTPFVVDLLRKAGAKKIHLRICSPPIKWPCHFGVDFATKNELLAANKSIEDIQNFVKADSLGYLSIEGLMESVPKPKNKYCDACFTGKYPIPVQLEMNKFALEN